MADQSELKFPAFPFKPYSIQIDFMTALYQSLDRGGISMLESPTGHQSGSDDEPDWMKNFVADKEIQVKEKKEIKKKKQGIRSMKVDNLFNPRREDEGFCEEKDQKNVKDKMDGGELNDEEFLVEEYESEEEGGLGCGKSKRKAGGVSVNSSSEEEDDGFDDEDEEEAPLKIYFCSRTHSQLTQFIKELRKTVFASQLKVVCLGSRKNFCINEEVLKLGNSTRINERCLELQKRKKDDVSKMKNLGSGGRIRRTKASSGCPMLRKQNLQTQFRSEIYQEGALDIEDIVRLGSRIGTCPYYGSRSMVPAADLVVLPYQSLLSKSSRESLGLNLKNSIVIIDEAHNLADSLISMYDSKITLSQLERVHSQLGRVPTYLASQVSGYGDKAGGLYNGSTVRDGVDESNDEGTSLSGFQALADMLISLTNNDGDGRIIISRRPTCSGQEGGYLKYVMLTGEKIFSEVEELGLLLSNLVSVIPEGIVVFFSSFDYEGQVYDAWKASGILARIAKRKHVFREPRKNTDMEVVLKEYKNAIDASSNGDLKADSAPQKGAVLLAVVGGKISEGINFSDGMGRCILMVGLPYPSPSDIELIERVKHIEGLGDPTSSKPPEFYECYSGDVKAGFGILRNCKRRGKEYYENLCMKAVNQSIGRAIRHINDYAAILLVDARYAADSSKRSFSHPTNKLPQWIKGRLVSKTNNYGEVHRLLHQFFKYNRERARVK
ncbi:RAD3-like DNA-binding helicase protein [Actinidia rufa]|uniref:RAD3-like DNA-binding helicase protein n=1 Tax=Actinidia rufa TaxID=165716 RepID=A0A7J0FEA5_9ERIC|nr:RAD3-like DNA-binding helicase protein [Actinidia rufa]